MGAPAAVSAIGTTQCGKLVTQEMFVARPAMSAAAEYPYLVYKIALLQNRCLKWCCC